MADPLTLRIHPADDVVIARHQLVGGTVLADEGITVAGLVPPGHKVAVRAIAPGAPVRRYNQIIGTAKRPIEAGQHVHSHNLEFASFARDYAACTATQPTQFVREPATFMGLRRADGRVATRNFIGLLKWTTTPRPATRPAASPPSSKKACARLPRVAPPT